MCVFWARSASCQVLQSDRPIEGAVEPVADMCAAIKNFTDGAPRPSVTFESAGTPLPTGGNTLTGFQPSRW